MYTHCNPKRFGLQQRIFAFFGCVSFQNPEQLRRGLKNLAVNFLDLLKKFKSPDHCSVFFKSFLYASFSERPQPISNLIKWKGVIFLSQ
jgi:hypothetical protein